MSEPALFQASLQQRNDRLLTGKIGKRHGANIQEIGWENKIILSGLKWNFIKIFGGICGIAGVF
jgi:hypothetical protein